MTDDRLAAKAALRALGPHAVTSQRAAELWPRDLVVRLDAATDAVAEAAQPTRVDVVAKEDESRIDWLEAVLRPGDPAVEVFLAGLRHSATATAGSYQVELAPGGDLSGSRVFNGPSLRNAIDAAIASRTAANPQPRALATEMCRCGHSKTNHAEGLCGAYVLVAKRGVPCGCRQFSAGEATRDE